MRKHLESCILFLCLVALLAFAALSGVWMKKPDKKQKDQPSITVIVPPQERHDPVGPYTVPDAKRYAL